MALLAALAVVAVAVLVVTQYHQHGPKVVELPIVPPPRHLGLPANGLDYYEPSGFFTQCPDWTWLQTRCFQTRHDRAGYGGIAGSVVLDSDLDFVRAAHLGGFLRVWVSLDQLMRWNSLRGFAGYVPAYLNDVDRAMREFDRHQLRVDLVLFIYSKDAHWTNQFRPQALDGLHPEMRSGYLRALGIFIRHLASNRTDAATVRVVDLQTEPYYQLEQYFDTKSTLGSYGYCLGSDGKVVSSCVDGAIIHPWLTALYRVSRRASHRFLYTESDTGRLLTADGATQAHWISMYPVDVYDIHAYANAPWQDVSRWETALHLPKPWFSGEVGCASGDAACTYNGSAAFSIDRWWVTNLHRFRAQAVLVENHVTLWTYPYGLNSQSLTPTGELLQCRSDPRTLLCRNSRL